MPRIDAHAHLLPGIDDGCEDLDQALASVDALRLHGYAGTLCTPHVWPELFPANTPSHIHGLTIRLQRELDRRGVAYRLWPGGELRLFKGAPAWMEKHGVPNMADSRCVLCDLWEDKWPRHADETLAWLIDRGYEPILAHPERINIPDGELDDELDRLAATGVRFQGNFNCFTGREGHAAAERVRRYLDAGRYALMAMDLHRPEALETRLEGLRLMADEFGVDAVDALTDAAPRELFGLDAGES